MTKLKSTTVQNYVDVDTIQDSNNENKINVARISDGGGYYARRIIKQIDSATYANLDGTRYQWTLGPTLPEITGVKANSILNILYTFPVRHNGESWGGFLVEPQVSLNGGLWFSLGGSGYDQMYMSSRNISTYTNTMRFDPGQALDYNVQFRFYFTPYDGVVTINGSHAINSVSGMADMMMVGSENGHYMSLLVEELTPFSGD